MPRQLIGVLLATLAVAGCTDRESPRESANQPPNSPQGITRPATPHPSSQRSAPPAIPQKLAVRAVPPHKNHHSMPGVITTPPSPMAPATHPALPLEGKPRTVIPKGRFRYWWWKKRHTQLQKRLDHTTRMDLIFVGDSLTHYWELDGKQTWAASYGKLNAFNFGSGGDRTQHILYRLKESRFGRLAPSVAVVMAGTNNLDVGDSPKETVLGINAIVTLLQKRFSGISVIVLGILPRGLPRNRIWRNARRANRLLAALRRPGTVYVLDMESAFTASGRTKKTLYGKDGVHLSSKGYAVWDRTLRPLILKLLKKSRGTRGSMS